MKNHTFHAGFKRLLYEVVFGSKIKVSQTSHKMFLKMLIDEYLFALNGVQI